MDKSILYLDLDDDITSVIGKLADTSKDTVALVVPKRSTILQSIVNLKLIQKSAKTANKSVVLITDDGITKSLAARLKMQVAPTIKDEPAVPVIDNKEVELPSDTIHASGEPAPILPTPKPAAASKTGSVAKTSADKKKNPRIPDFDKFKKKLLLIGLGLVIVGVGLWFGLRGLPRATVTVKTITEKMDTEFAFTADTAARNVDTEKGIVPAVAEEINKTLTATFKPTGQKDVGTKSGGNMTIINCENSTGVSLPTGTVFAANSNSLKFITNSAITVPGSSFAGGGVCQEDGTATVAVTAEKAGDIYNLAPTNYTMNGNSNITGTGSQMSGGTTKLVPSITQADIDTAKTALLAKEKEAAKTELAARFESNEKIIESTLKESVGEVASNPALDQEASEQATLTIKVVYSELAVKQDDLKVILEHTEREKLKQNQSSQTKAVLKNGLEDVKVTQEKEESAAKRILRLKTVATVGPDLKLEELAREIAGKGYSQALEYIKSKPNIEQAEIDFSPFWVFKVPKNVNRIQFNIVSSDGV